MHLCQVQKCKLSLPHGLPDLHGLPELIPVTCKGGYIKKSGTLVVRTSTVVVREGGKIVEYTGPGFAASCARSAHQWQHCLTTPLDEV